MTDLDAIVVGEDDTGQCVAIGVRGEVVFMSLDDADRFAEYIHERVRELRRKSAS